MKRLLLLTAIFLNSINSNAEAFLCITEAVAGVAQGDSVVTNATIYTPADNKFIVSDAGGKWTFKPFGEPEKTLQCYDSRYCGNHIGNSTQVPMHVFFRTTDKFHFVTNAIYDNEKGGYTEIFVHRGSCESI
tara:strand:- start:340 stop:735 length:396 start_codon:yes stop_codon:yes gene_type:complete